MILPRDVADVPSSDRLARRRIRVGLFLQNKQLVIEVLDADADIVVGASGDGVLAVPGWVGPSVRMISKGRWLALGPGMNLHACHEDGEDRIRGSFEELSGAGVAFPMFINVARLNIRIRDSLVLLVEYVRGS